MALDLENLVNVAKAQNDYMKRRFSTKESSYNYKVGQISYLHNLTYGLLWVYFILAALYLAIIMVGPKSKNYSYVYKLLTLIFLVLFPYIVTPVEMFLLRGLSLIVETIFGNVFNRPDHEYVIDYSYLPKFFSY